MKLRYCMHMPNYRIVYLMNVVLYEFYLLWHTNLLKILYQAIISDCDFRSFYAEIINFMGIHFEILFFLYFYVCSVSFCNSLNIYTITPIVLWNLHYEHVKSLIEMSVHRVQNYLIKLNHSTDSFRKLIYFENHIYTK